MNDIVVTIREYTPQDETNLIALWNVCGLTRPWNNPSLDIQRKLEGQRDWLLLGMLDRKLVASVMVGYDGHRGWINYLAVDPEHRKSGIGRQLVAESESLLRGINCPKINLQIRHDNVEAIQFYESIGFVEDEVVSMGKRLIDDSGPDRGLFVTPQN